MARKIPTKHHYSYSTVKLKSAESKYSCTKLPKFVTQVEAQLVNVNSDVEQLWLHSVYGVRRSKVGWVAMCEALVADCRMCVAAVRDTNEAGSSSHKKLPQ